MVKTAEGDIIIHKEIWDKMKNESHYQDFAEQIEDLEDHLESVKIGDPMETNEFFDSLENE